MRIEFDPGRREFLVKASLMGVGFIISACSSQAPLQPSTEPCDPQRFLQPQTGDTLQTADKIKGIKRTEGEWTGEEMQYLGEIMTGCSDFREIHAAGRTLLRYLQFPMQAFPEISSIFAGNTPDTPFRIISRASPMQDTVVVNYGTYEKEDEKVKAILEPRTSGKPYIEIIGANKFVVKSVDIQPSVFRDGSEFLLGFHVAWGINYFRALDDALTYILDHDESFQKYYLPKDKPRRNTIKVDLMTRTGQILVFYGQKPIVVIDFVRMWVDFLMVPDYMLAKDRGMFTAQELRMLTHYESAARELMKAGLLRKTKDGIYEWDFDKPNFYKIWEDLAWKLL